MKFWIEKQQDDGSVEGMTKKLLAIAFMAVVLNAQAAELVVFTRDTWGICKGYGDRVHHIAYPKGRQAIDVARSIDPNITFAYWRQWLPLVAALADFILQGCDEAVISVAS